MTTFYNVYAYTRAGERVIADLSLPAPDAEQRAELEAAFIESMGDAVERYGDTWFMEDWMPRVGLFDVMHDPFVEMNAGVVWLPEVGG